LADGRRLGLFRRGPGTKMQEGGGNKGRDKADDDVKQRRHDGCASRISPPVCPGQPYALQKSAPNVRFIPTLTGLTDALSAPHT
jgi:hypothetical protein